MNNLKKIECLTSVLDFYKTKKASELVIYLIVPFLIGIVFWGITIFLHSPASFSYISFISDFLDTIITVIALFISFSMAYLTILISSDSENIKALKTNNSKKYKIDNNNVSLFQLLMIDITYNVLIEITMLLFAFLQKFLIIVSTDFFIKIYISIDIIILVHIILLLVRNLSNMYFSFWKSV